MGFYEDCVPREEVGGVLEENNRVLPVCGVSSVTWVRREGWAPCVFGGQCVVKGSEGACGGVAAGVSVTKIHLNVAC